MIQPDFIITGGYDPDYYDPNNGIFLFASRNLKEIVVDEDYYCDERFYSRLLGGPLYREEISINVKVREFVQVVGPNYQAAWAKLFNTWEPPVLRKLREIEE